MGTLRQYIMLPVLLVFPAFLSLNLTAQQSVLFGTYASEGLEANVLPPYVLDFGSIVSGEETTVSIRMDNEERGEIVPIEIIGPAYHDVTVYFPSTIQLIQEDVEDNPDEMTLAVRLAYSNRGLELPAARNSYTEVPAGQSQITFQIKRRGLGPPGPPPTPPHAGYTPKPGTAYVFIYGDLTVGNVSAGTYKGQIDIQVEYYGLPIEE